MEEIAANQALEPDAVRVVDKRKTRCIIEGENDPLSSRPFQIGDDK